MADDLTPTELARLVGMDRRDVISKCMELGVPIFHGRIDKVLFLTSVGADPGQPVSDPEAAHFVIFDSSGNMIDSFESAPDAARAARAIREADGGQHFEVIAYDANGDVIEPRAPARTSAAR